MLQGQSLAIAIIAGVLIATQTIDVDSLRESAALMGPRTALVLLWPVVTAVEFCQVCLCAPHAHVHVKLLYL